MKKILLIISAILIIILCVSCIFLFVGKDEYTVTFLDQQGTVLQEAVYQKGETLSVPQDPSMEGHAFAGWVLDGDNDVYDFEKDGAKAVYKNLRFTAKFTPNSYTVKFVAANGADIISQGTYTYGEKFQVPEAPNREGHSFTGWMKQGEQSMYDFNADGATVVKADATFIAQYDAIRSKVIFANHDGSAYKTQTYNYGEYFAVPEAPARDGYLFMGWALSGETERYDFEKENAKLVGDKDITFVAIYDKLEIVAGSLYKVDGTAIPQQVTILFGKVEQTVIVDKSGVFTTQLPAGKYTVVVKLDGYTSVCGEITVKAGQNSIGAIKLLQAVVSDMSWWDEGKLVQNDSSVTITMPNDAHPDAGHEFRVGEYINDATSWKISAHIAAGARGRHGFSVGTTGANGTVFFFLDGDRAGYYTWWTYQNEAAGIEKTWALSESAKEAVASTDGYELSLVGTNINGEGTGWLTLYVNDIAVMQVENTFVGGKDSPHVTEGAKLNLSKVHLSLTVRGNGSTATYSDYYYTINSEKDLTLGNVTGSLVKLDGTKLPATIVLSNGLVDEIVDVDREGKITCALPAGNYQLVTEGYSSVSGDIEVKVGDNNVGQIKLRQSLNKDMEWWSGSTLTEIGNAANITIAGDAHADAGYEARLGEYINDATSWKISAHIAAGARGRHGFSVGTTGANGTVFFFLDGDWAGYYTWWTYLNPNGGTEETWMLPDAAKAAIASADGYDLSLVATNINGEGTGWLTLYVNDVMVVRIPNDFVGGAGSPHVGEGAKLNLSKVHLSLAVRGSNTTATYSDYYYTVNSETAPVLQELNKDMEWWSGSTLTQNTGSATISVASDASGDAGYEARVGEYINDATSWRISAHIAAGARGRHGFSVGTTGANGTVFFFLDGDWAGYYTWWTYLNPNGGTEETWMLPDAAKAAIASADGYDLSLVATNINGEGTGTMTLYVNEIAVVQMENIFVGGGGPHVGEGVKLDLSKVHLSLAVRGNNSTATFSEYFTAAK